MLQSLPVSTSNLSAGAPAPVDIACPDVLIEGSMARRVRTYLAPTGHYLWGASLPVLRPCVVATHAILADLLMAVDRPGLLVEAFNGLGNSPTIPFSKSDPLPSVPENHGTDYLRNSNTKPPYYRF